jgi:hypothetical protein
MQGARIFCLLFINVCSVIYFLDPQTEKAKNEKNLKAL